MSNNLGAAMAGGNGTRAKDDFYPTPPEATQVLLDHYVAQIPEKVHECACGDGAMAKVMGRNGYFVLSTDLVFRGHGIGGVDFLSTGAQCPAVITNPPFALAEDFIRKALDNPDVVFTAMLLKTTFWNAARRADLFAKHPPNGIHPLMWRLDFTGGGAPTMDVSWFVWNRNWWSEGEQEFRPFVKTKGAKP